MGELKMLSKIPVKEFDSKVANYKPAHSYGWKWHFLAKKLTQYRKTFIHNSAKTYGILLK